MRQVAHKIKFDIKDTRSIIHRATDETLAYLKSASKNGKPDLEEMWKFLQSTYSPELKNSVSPSTGNSAPSEESTDDVEENSETEKISSTVPEQKISHYDSNDLEFLAD